MAIYEYKAIMKSGRSTRGVIDADSPATARRKLREQGLFPTEIVEAKGDKVSAVAAVEASPGESRRRQLSFGRVSVRDIAMMTRQFAVLLHAGMPLVEALGATLAQTSKPRLKKALYDIRDKVKGGSSLADALARHPKVFSSLYSNMVGAGEAGGALEQVLFRLADILEHQAKLKSRIISTLMYPMFMALFAVGVIIFMMLVIVPRITLIFEKQKQELPGVTKVLIGVSRFIGDYWWILLLAAAGLFFLWRIWVVTQAGRMRWDRIKLKAPVYGGLQIKLITARFARTLGTMLESGLPMMQAMDVVRTVVDNRVIEEALAEVKAGVRRGKDLAQPLRESGLFPPMLIHMVDLGQRSGEMEGMLLKVADTYDEDVRLAMDAMVSLMEPVIIVIMGLFVGFLVFSILLPILNMSRQL
ncbi:MAG TPA: type II secretion system inner membrane protein GspF [Candidatus Hydrogenedentes bacterium]|nr:type II secretion system inner membrane protein GspF [Candidatus Hydrogenedentota bacterium]HOV74467.1 type II secretion system inner membrane protein GspF [Candidatus Hydrogenedentota bacterium]HPC17261.1 type II secretion system inner membrane protein GspF [Candidatus Hydrogenedentota bacterium]HRT21176.1 type II secretion system inner membrane protein GspF [Candidatus Hydrogenedentota bacterium]HRT65957.1 type II secretion system inner membrane protein GspF [Candidatus Hydrogenedentota ba